MITLVDSTVLLDVATGDPQWSRWSEKALVDAADSGQLAINPIIFAEVSVGFSTIDDLNDALPSETFLRLQLPYVAAFLAGQAFQTYRTRGGLESAPLPDFYIGAHAAVAGYRLLTREATRYRRYFPTVTVLAPF